MRRLPSVLAYHQAQRERRAGRLALRVGETSGLASVFSSLQLSTPTIASKMTMTAMLKRVGSGAFRHGYRLGSAPRSRRCGWAAGRSSPQTARHLRGSGEGGDRVMSMDARMRRLALQEAKPIA